MTTASDLVRWARFNLDAGAFQGRRFVSEEALGETRRPQNILTPAYQALFNPDGLLNAYGFGWVLSEHRGSTLVEHGGALPGYGAVIAMIPEHKIGLVLLSNLSFTQGIPTLLKLKFGILDRVLDEKRDGAQQP